jgi:soluble lytic murein transglycosylase-like protein
MLLASGAVTALGGGSASSIDRVRAHVVISGDTLTGIALRYDVALSDIRSMNSKLVSKSGGIRIGTRLRVPTVNRMTTLPATLRLNRDRLRLRPLIRKWSAANDIPADLVEATLYLESGWNQERVSSTGAVGVGQLMPGTAAFIKSGLIGARAGGLTLDERRPEDNIRMSARYLRFLLKFHGGDPTSALHAYYQGIGSIRSRGLYNDTRNYAAAIQSLRARFRADTTGTTA